MLLRIHKDILWIYHIFFNKTIYYLLIFMYDYAKMYNNNIHVNKFTTMVLYCLNNSPYNAGGSSTHLTLAPIPTERKKNKERCCEDSRVETSLLFTMYVIQMDQLLFIVAIIKKSHMTLLFRKIKKKQIIHNIIYESFCSRQFF